jgi:hypothetical protein
VVSVSAQEQVVPVEPVVVVDPTQVLPTPEELEGHIKRWKDVRDQQTDEGLKKQAGEIVSVYEQAREQLLELQKQEKIVSEFQDARKNAPDRLTAVKEQLDKVKAEQAAKPSEGVPVDLTQARSILLKLTAQVLQRKLDSYSEEILSYDARGELLTVRRELAARQLSYTEKLAVLWREVLNKRRRLEAEKTAQQAQQASEEAAQAHPLIQKLAQENAQLAELRIGSKGLVNLNVRLTGRVKEIEKQLSDMNVVFATLQDKVKIAGLTDVMGVVLLSKKNSLPDFIWRSQIISFYYSE